MANKVAIVTGANKGIGFGIVEELCKRGVETIYLTARDIKRGEDAIDKLKKEGHDPIFHQLDVTDRASIEKFAENIEKKYGGLDIIVNNAGTVSIDNTEITYEHSKHVLNVNYFSLLMIQEILYPLLNDNARVINIVSDCGHISNLRNTYWISRLTKNYLEQKDIDEFVNWFLNSVKNGTLKLDDFVEAPIIDYKVSKIAVCALTRLQQRQVGRGIIINSLHPGYVKTDLSKHAGTLTIEESSKTPVYLALDADPSLKGKYILPDRTEKDWADPALKLYNKFEVVLENLKNTGVM